jgi:hypothetical protein
MICGNTHFLCIGNATRNEGQIPGKNHDFIGKLEDF